MLTLLISFTKLLVIINLIKTNTFFLIIHLKENYVNQTSFKNKTKLSNIYLYHYQITSVGRERGRERKKEVSKAEGEVKMIIYIEKESFVFRKVWSILSWGHLAYKVQNRESLFAEIE